MCGIVGLWTQGGCDMQAVIRRMNAQIPHRGPDDEGYHCDRGMWFGVRRLSVIDLVAGAQPMSTSHGGHHIVYNGELYNYRELRTELEAAGVTFRTHSDTEVIVNAYATMGPKCVERFNGMFAFAIWDSTAQRLFLARDRFGIKPLYYSWDGETLLFGSEIKSILASGLQAKDVNHEAIWHYLTFRYVPSPQTIWKNVYKLPPAHTLTFSTTQRTLSIERYWDLRFASEGRDGNGAGHREEFESRFLQAVKSHLVADVPVGVFLSGGIDSSAVVAAAIEVGGGPVSTFSVAFPECDDTNELAYAREVASYFKTDHHEVTLGLGETLDALPELMWHADEPIGDPAIVPLYYVSKLASANVKVALSGEGADELLGGYDFERAVQSWERLANFQRWPRAARYTVPNVVLKALGRESALARLELHNVPLAERNLRTLPHMTRYFGSAAKHQLWPSASASASFSDSDEIVRGYYSRAATNSPLHQVLYAYCQDWLTEDLLMKADKATMATSVELRVPFLDHTFAEWLASLPPAVKVARNGGGQIVTKYLLRQFCEGRLPANIVTRPKKGFPVPLVHWTRGKLGGELSRMLLGTSSIVASMFDRKYLAEMVAEAPRSPFGSQRAWLLFVLEHWMRRWL
ncbi:MAG TPA: asparagine synthase (glutamine-hydrolyzing) [Gemmatimonadaceae bacterium]|nr:asparagine synthase (glutamine-hydrolyzing) [Gemmatimonadaceae bacterium]